MKWQGLNELREKYLSFFESKNHTRLPSFSPDSAGRQELAAHQLRYGTAEKVLSGTGCSAECTGYYLSEVHPDTGY